MTAVASRDDVEPVQNEALDRFLTGTFTVVPFAAVIGAGVLTWQQYLHWSDLIIFFVLYVLTGLGITVGFHRMLTHRAFKAKKWVRAMFTIFGSAAIEGPVIAWVADHRKHHAFADMEGDPHSPHVDHGHGVKGALRGLVHAHVGWLFLHTQRAKKARYAPDLIADPTVSAIDRTFILWVTLGLAIPFPLGVLLGGSVTTGLTAMLWGGLVRVFLLHHVTYSINSLCHFFGRRRFDTGDESRNLLWLAPLSFGESWHNNHHAFPTSARHGLRPWELDTSAGVIWALEKLGLVWDVVRISPERQARKALEPVRS
jgi:stearoyl-CoA desaturase (delta-9 desaturase)